MHGPMNVKFVGEVVSVQIIGAVNRECFVELCFCLTSMFVSVMKVPVGHTDRYSRLGGQ